MSDDRTLPPPRRRPLPPALPRSQTPESPIEAVRPRQDTLRDGWPSERLDRPEEASELEAARERESKLLRQLKAAEAAKKSVPPRIEMAPASSGKPSVAPGTDQALGRFARTLLMRAGGGLLLAVLGGGAGVAVDRQASPKVDVAAYEERIKRLEDRLTNAREDDKAWKQRASQVFNCRAEQQSEVNAQLLPDPERLVNQRKPRAWADECPVKIKAPD